MDSNTEAVLKTVYMIQLKQRNEKDSLEKEKTSPTTQDDDSLKPFDPIALMDNMSRGASKLGLNSLNPEVKELSLALVEVHNAYQILLATAPESAYYYAATVHDLFEKTMKTSGSYELRIKRCKEYMLYLENQRVLQLAKQEKLDRMVLLLERVESQVFSLVVDK